MRSMSVDVVCLDWSERAALSAFPRGRSRLGMMRFGLKGEAGRSVSLSSSLSLSLSVSLSSSLSLSVSLSLSPSLSLSSSLRLEC